MACSPGGRLVRFSLISTPFALCESVAVPMLWPCEFCICTVTVCCARPVPANTVNVIRDDRMLQDASLLIAILILLDRSLNLAPYSILLGLSADALIFSRPSVRAGRPVPA